MAERPTSAAKVWREGDDSEEESEEESEGGRQTLAQARAAMAAAGKDRVSRPGSPRRPRLDPGRPDRRTCSGTASRIPGPPRARDVRARPAEVVSSVNGVLDSMDTFRRHRGARCGKVRSPRSTPSRFGTRPRRKRDPPTRMEMETDDTGIVSEYATAAAAPRRGRRAGPFVRGAVGSRPVGRRARPRRRAPLANAASARAGSAAEEVAALPEIPGAREEGGGGSRGEAGAWSSAPVRDDAGASAAEGAPGAPGAPAFSAVSAVSAAARLAVGRAGPPPPPPRAAPSGLGGASPRGYASRLGRARILLGAASARAGRAEPRSGSRGSPGLPTAPSPERGGAGLKLEGASRGRGRGAPRSEEERRRLASPGR